MKVKIVPTILTQNFAEFKERLRIVQPFFDLVQIDCADARFVGNRTFYNVNEVNRAIKVNYELHLMILNPLAEIKKWEKFKKVKKVIFHFEAVKKEKEILEIIKYLHRKGIKAGLAINPETKLEKVKKLLPLLDQLLIMGVKPGWGGQKMKLKVIKFKVRKVRKLFPKLNIEVDGGVNLQNARQIIKAGANTLAIGRSLNSGTDIKRFKKLI